MAWVTNLVVRRLLHRLAHELSWIVCYVIVPHEVLQPLPLRRAQVVEPILDLRRRRLSLHLHGSLLCNKRRAAPEQTESDGARDAVPRVPQT